MLSLVEERALRLLCHWEVPPGCAVGFTTVSTATFSSHSLEGPGIGRKRGLLLPRELNFLSIGKWGAVFGSLDLWATGLAIATPAVLTNGSC